MPHWRRRRMSSVAFPGWGVQRDQKCRDELRLESRSWPLLMRIARIASTSVRISSIHGRRTGKLFTSLRSSGLRRLAKVCSFVSGNEPWLQTSHEIAYRGGFLAFGIADNKFKRHRWRFNYRQEEGQDIVEMSAQDRNQIGRLGNVGQILQQGQVKSLGARVRWGLRIHKGLTRSVDFSRARRSLEHMSST